MSRFLDLLFSTPGIVVAFFISAVWIVARPRSIAVKRSVLTAATIYLLASLYVVPVVVSRLLTFGYDRLEHVDTPSEKTVLVVLGAGAETVFGWNEHLSVPNALATARILETWRVYQLLNPRWVITSGGNLRPDDAAEPSSTNMRDVLVRLGVPADRIVLESQSRNTHDEAVLIAPVVRSLGAERIVLVTSAVHMRRSVGAFRALGLDPVPAIAPDPRHQAPWSHWLLPARDGLRFSNEIVHELAGIPYYWMRGWWK